MSKAAARNKTTTKGTPPEDEVNKLAANLAAKQQFMASTANMGWRLALTVVVPIVAGVKLDEHFKSAPSYTLTGLFLAAAAGSYAVWQTIKEVNREQAEDAEASHQEKQGEK